MPKKRRKIIILLYLVIKDYVQKKSYTKRKCTKKEIKRTPKPSSIPNKLPRLFAPGCHTLEPVAIGTSI